MQHLSHLRRLIEETRTSVAQSRRRSIGRDAIALLSRLLTPANASSSDTASKAAPPARAVCFWFYA